MNNKTRPAFAKVLANVRDSLPTLILQSYIPITASNNTAFRITASHAKPFSKNSQFVLADYIDMAHEALGDQFQLIAGTLEHVNDTHKDTIVSGIVVANTVSKEISAKELRKDKGYRLVSANVFMDDEDKIWKMIGDGENRRLVQAIQEDLNKILESRLARKSNQVVASSMSHYMGVTPSRGDYVVFYSVVSGDYEYGYAIIADGDIYVAPRNKEGAEKIDSAQVIACVEADCLPAEKQDKQVLSMMFGNNKATTGNFSADMGKEYLDYMRQIYADTPYFSKLEELVSKRRNLADMNQPLSTSEV